MATAASAAHCALSPQAACSAAHRLSAAAAAVVAAVASFADVTSICLSRSHSASASRHPSIASSRAAHAASTSSRAACSALLNFVLRWTEAADSPPHDGQQPLSETLPIAPTLQGVVTSLMSHATPTLAQGVAVAGDGLVIVTLPTAGEWCANDALLAGVTEGLKALPRKAFLVESGWRGGSG